MKYGLRDFLKVICSHTTFNTESVTGLCTNTLYRCFHWFLLKINQTNNFVQGTQKSARMNERRRIMYMHAFMLKPLVTDSRETSRISFSESFPL